MSVLGSLGFKIKHAWRSFRGAQSNIRETSWLKLSHKYLELKMTAFTTNGEWIAGGRLDYSKVEDSIFNSLRINDWAVTRTMIEGSEFDGIVWEQCKFVQVTFSNCAFKDVSMRNCTFINCMFHNCTFSNVGLSDGTTVTRTHFSDMPPDESLILGNTLFTNCQFESKVGDERHRATLIDGKFRGCRFDNVNISTGSRIYSIVRGEYPGEPVDMCISGGLYGLEIVIRKLDSKFINGGVAVQVNGVLCDAAEFETKILSSVGNGGSKDKEVALSMIDLVRSMADKLG